MCPRAREYMPVSTMHRGADGKWTQVFVILEFITLALIASGTHNHYFVISLSNTLLCTTVSNTSLHVFLFLGREVTEEARDTEEATDEPDIDSGKKCN